MTRFDVTRYEISGVLSTDSPLAIGSLKGELVDMPIQRDGAGTPIIPGTALAGALRARLETPHWGSTESASMILVEDAPLTSKPMLDVREGVSLNRFTGTAETGFLYDFEVLPQGTQFAFRMSVDADGDNVVSQLLATLTAGFAVGRSTSTGLGKVQLTEPSVTRRHLASRDDLIGYVISGKARACQVTAAPHDRPTTTRIRVPWVARGPVLVADDAEGDAVDIVPKVSRVWQTGEKRVQLVIPGSSIKGALRAHTEAILRTVLGIESGNRPAGQEWPEDRRDNHKADLRPEGGMSLIEALFGSAGERGGQGRKASLAVSDCSSSASWPEHLWRAVTAASKNDGEANGFAQARLLASLCRLDGPCKDQKLNGCEHLAPGRFVIGEHVAIDRWTGGASDGALYAVLEPWFTAEGDWTEVDLHIDVQRLGDSGQAALFLLLLALRDLCEGWVPLGYGAAKGYGHLSADLEKAQVSGPAGATTLAILFGDDPPDWVRNARASWLEWVSEHKVGEGA